MSLHPNDIARRARMGSIGLGVIFAILIGAFFRAQVIEYDRYKLQSEENRLRAIPLPAPRGIIYDRKGEVIAENLPGYSVSIAAAKNVDSLRADLERLSTVIPLTQQQKEAVVRRYRRDPNRPTVIISDASFDVISVLEEHRINFPQLIIQSVPKRFYPDGPAVASFVGYTGEITDAELNKPEYAGYKPGQVIGKVGLEKQYERELRGREGVRYDEVDARGRVVRQASPKMGVDPQPAPVLNTNIDLDLQRFVVSIFGDSLQGGAVAMDPNTGAVLALHSAPSFDPNRFTGGISIDYWRTLSNDPRRPLFNKAIQGTYPPGSTFKLATAVTALEHGLVTFDERMPVPCAGGYQYGSRYFRCWDRKGHGNVNLARAIEVSCDTYFYQLGLRIGLSRLLAGGVSLGANGKSGIDLPEEGRSTYPSGVEYYNKRYGPRNWTNAVILNLSIGQGENSQTVVNMAKFYTALATDGHAVRPTIMKHSSPERERIFRLSPEQMENLRKALAGVVAPGGTAAGSRIEGVMLAGKTGTAQQSGKEGDHAWFVGFAPADKPTIVVAVMLEFGLHGSRAARIASAIISHYLKVTPRTAVQMAG
jgi:penicillin-binding protein 2